MPLTLTVLHDNVQQPKSLTSCSYQNTRSRSSFFVVGKYITDNPVCSPVGLRFRLALLFEKNHSDALVFLVHYVKKKNFFLNSV